ncbi:3-oxoacyl-[acyl-carrier-protein] synthase [Tulasnella sp. 424]|nr:3-oxoacyl-[acyl-carrier-protein] synthase [Tulasnella sp. 424]
MGCHSPISCLLAVYPEIPLDFLVTLNADQIIARDPGIERTLGTTRKISVANSKEFGKKNDKAEGRTLWPLIRIVKVRCPAKALESGAVLVDLPGTADANAARSSIAQGHMQRCQSVWIMAPITRAVDDRTAKATTCPSPIYLQAETHTPSHRRNQQLSTFAISPSMESQSADILEGVNGQEGTPIVVAISSIMAFPIMIDQRQFSFQFPLWQELKHAGLPIEGLCVAAVASTKNAAEIIDALPTAGIKHFTFKPGSIDGIRQVVTIAAANPDLPTIYQWTGGRAGEHPYSEDFHQPILDPYGPIRQQSKSLSCFGGSEDVWPYITGDWSLAYGSSQCPSTGFSTPPTLWSRRRLTPLSETLEAYCGPLGLVEPIHKVAACGVKLWKGFDNTDRDSVTARLDKEFSVPEEEGVTSSAVKRRLRASSSCRDLLWAAEDIAAVFDQDPQRVCTIQGPIAAKYCTRADEPISELLGNIEAGLIKRILISDSE